MPSSKTSSRLRVAVALVVLAALLASVFFPAWGYDFTGMDVTETIVDNPYIRGLTAANVWHILTSRCIHSYYPVRTLSFALDHTLWGLDPLGFKLTNTAIHFMNVALLFFWLRRLLDGSGQSTAATGAAFLAAAVFAVHPLVVEPVAWICGREELLLASGALAAAHFHLSARQAEQAGSSRRRVQACWALVYLSCLAACGSNVVGLAVPLILTALDVIFWPQTAWRRRAAAMAPLWALAAVVVAVKKLTPDAGVRVAAEPEMFSWVRLELIFSTYWQNIAALFWPVRLAAYYGQDLPSAKGVDLAVVAGGVAAAVTALAAWFARRQPLPLAGLAWFLLALAPAAQIVPHHIYRADRFLYLPLVGLSLATGWLLLAAAERLTAAYHGSTRIGVMGGRVAAAGLLAGAVAAVFAMAWQSERLHAAWKTDVALWTNAVAAVPNNTALESMLADSLAAAGETDAAVRHYRKALKADAGNVAVLNNYAGLLATARESYWQDYGEAIRMLEHGCRLTAWDDPDLPDTLALARARYAARLDAEGRPAQAIEQNWKVLKITPLDSRALLRQAHLLATCRDESLRNPDEAVRLAERGCRLADPAKPEPLGILVTAYAAAGRTDEALAAAGRGLALAEAARDAAMVRQFEDQWVGLRQSLLRARN